MRGGIFMPLPWSALANPLESLRGLWQLHIRPVQSLPSGASFPGKLLETEQLQGSVSPLTSLGAARKLGLLMQVFDE